MFVNCVQSRKTALFVRFHKTRQVNISSSLGQNLQECVFNNITMNIHFLTLDNDFPYMALTQFHLIVAGDTVMDRMTQNQVLQEGGERLCVLLEKRTVLDAGANKTKNS